jgi:1-deoxy-D-xylulose-5-phosphate synthase
MDIKYLGSKNFHTNRQLGGISGFPKSESDDTFVGHSSTSISGTRYNSSNLKGRFNKHHIAIIGDASIASGMAFEG